MFPRVPMVATQDLVRSVERHTRWQFEQRPLVAQNGATGVRYVWSKWSDSGAISHTVAPITSKTYTATFNTQYFLTMSAGTGGKVTPASGWKTSE